MQALASAWSDDDARAVVTECATQDTSFQVRIAAVQALVGASLDYEAAILLSRGLDGVVPFLDPKDPAPDSHVARAAERLGLAEESVRERLSGYESVLGWDPLVGSE